ncbi:MAG: 3alpha(or 20beta)-hydroxysteroid dehydrogenase [Actinomycetota bacterium]|nr:3alpha(or 20beta)-hydroxysteroid dehydrogenase [Actinomycetota bacterium]
MGRLDGKVALISGAARGQGEAEARLFAAEGAKVVLADVLDEDGTTVAKDIGEAAAYLHLDVTSEDDWQAAVDKAIDRFGAIDVLVNNAGIFTMNGLATTSLEEYRRVIDINQVGVFLGMRAVSSHMAGRASGSIVNISSVAGLQGSMGTISYTASKFAVRGMTKVVAKELAPFGVRVNSVHPGLIDTAMLRQITDVVGDDDRLKASVPIGRFAAADDVANLVLFLASDESTYCTGAEFVVDGGMTA